TQEQMTETIYERVPHTTQVMQTVVRCVPAQEQVTQTVYEQVQVPQTVDVQVVNYQTQTRTEQRTRVVCDYVTETVMTTTRECVSVPVQRTIQVPVSGGCGTVMPAGGADCGGCGGMAIGSGGYA